MITVKKDPQIRHHETYTVADANGNKIGRIIKVKGTWLPVLLGGLSAGGFYKTRKAAAKAIADRTGN